MYIQGPSNVHASQSVRAPHKASGSAAAGSSSSVQAADELDISSEADLVSQVRDLPDIREDKVARIRQQIQNGTYDTDAKLEAALGKFLDEFEG